MLQQQQPATLYLPFQEEEKVQKQISFFFLYIKRKFFELHTEGIFGTYTHRVYPTYVCIFCILYTIHVVCICLHVLHIIFFLKIKEF